MDRQALSVRRTETTTQGEGRYAELQGLVAAGQARLLGERWDGRGRHVIAVGPTAGYAPNEERVSMRIGGQFFTNALRDYQDWREKWWREAIQNAVDAGATKVTCTVEELADGSSRVGCEDDGRGMDRETFVERFMVLGATGKAEGGTVGGFGKAKELLILPWISWSIKTRDMVIEGQGTDATIRAADERRGTVLSVVMPDGNTTSAEAAMSYIRKCWRPTVRFRVDGRLIRADLEPGETVRDFAGVVGDEEQATAVARLHYDKHRSAVGPRMLIRAGGLYMFDEWIPEGISGTILVELLRPSVEVLTANRDGFRDYDVKRQISSFIRELAVQATSALKAKAGIIRKKWRGRGRFLVEAPPEVVRAVAEQAFGGGVLSAGRARSIASLLAALVGREAPAEVAEEAPVRLVPASPAVAEAILAGLRLDDSAAQEAVAKQLVWTPDFFLVNEIEGWHVPRRFLPETMSRRARLLLHFWAELCRFVLIQLGSSASFGVGFLFTRDARAAYVEEEEAGRSEDWLMLNPLDKAEPREAHMLSPTKDVDWLYATAVHEVTHMADGIHYHDEAFAVALTKNMGRTYAGQRRVRAIWRAVGRGQEMG